MLPYNLIKWLKFAVLAYSGQVYNNPSAAYAFLRESRALSRRTAMTLKVIGEFEALVRKFENSLPLELKLSQNIRKTVYH